MPPRNSIGAVTQVEGLGDILASLRLLEKRIVNGGVSKALRAASKPIVEAMRAEVPVETGALKKSIGLKLRTYKGKRRVSVIGARKRPYQTPLGKRVPANYAHLVEFGVAPHDTREQKKVMGLKGVKTRVGKKPRMHPGHAGTGAMRRGFERAGPAAKAELIRVLKETVAAGTTPGTAPGPDEA